MKPILLSLVTSIAIAGSSLGQVAAIIGGVDYTDGQINFSIGTETIYLEILFENNTGTDAAWTLTRERINEKTSWSDYLCWGHASDPTGGSCYPSSTMDFTIWSTPGSLDILDGETAKAGVFIDTEDPDMGVSTYRYTLVQGGQSVAFVDVVISKTTSVEEQESPSVRIAPNPASDYINVTLSNTDNATATVKVVDVLGNVVMKEFAMSTSKQINTSRFRNGVYFVIVEAEGIDPINKKVIVRH